MHLLEDVKINYLKATINVSIMFRFFYGPTQSVVITHGHKNILCKNGCYAAILRFHFKLGSFPRSD